MSLPLFVHAFVCSRDLNRLFHISPQSGLKSGGHGSGLKKVSIFPRQIDERFRLFSGKNFRITSLSHLLQNVRLSRQNLPFTAKFWANYSISLEKSPLSNILPVGLHDKI